MSPDPPLAAQNLCSAPPLDPLEAVSGSLEGVLPLAGTLFLQHMSNFFQRPILISEAEFILSCKKVIALLQRSEINSLDQVVLIDVTEYAVISFIVRVFPFAPKGIGTEHCMLTPGLTAIISLLDLVDAHVSEDGDFSLQLRMEAIRRLLLDHSEISLLLYWASLPSLTRTPPSDGIQRPNFLGLHDLSLASEPHTCFQRLSDLSPITPNFTFRAHTSSNSDTVSPSLASFALCTPGSPSRPSTTTSFPDFTSEISQSHSEDILPLVRVNPRSSAPEDLDYSPQQSNSTFTNNSRSLLESQSLVILPPIASNVNQPPDNALYERDATNPQENKFDYEEQQRVESSTKPTMFSWSSVDPNVSPQIKLKYVPDNTREKFIPDDTADLETAALIMEKQSVISRPRRARSISSSLVAEDAISRRTRAQVRATSVNIPASPIAMSMPLPKPLSIVGGNDIKIPTYIKGRNVKARLTSEIAAITKTTTTEQIQWETDKPKPKRTRSRNRSASQKNVKDSDKENATEAETDSTKHIET